MGSTPLSATSGGTSGCRRCRTLGYGKGVLKIPFLDEGSEQARAGAGRGERDAGDADGDGQEQRAVLRAGGREGWDGVCGAQGAHDSIAVLHLKDDGTLAYESAFQTGKQDFPAGLALDDKGRLYAANNASADGDPFKLTGSVAIYDAKTRTELGRFAFKDSFGGTSNFPFGIAVLKDGSKGVCCERAG